MKKTLLPILLILVAACGFYAGTLHNDFVWDDRSLIIEDYHIRSPRFVSEIFARDFFSHSDDELKYGYYRPVVTLSYMADLALWGLRAAGFHATNILLHALCSILVFQLALLLLKTASGRNRFIALAAALFFAAHPVHTESVTWISGRTDVICTLFFLAALCIHAARRSLPAQALSVLCFALAMLSKEMAVTLPAIIFLSGYAREKHLRSAAIEALPFFAMAAAYFIWRSLVVEVEYNPGPGIGLFALLLSAIKTFWLYVLELVWPFPLNAYIRNPHVDDPLAPSMLVALALSAALLTALWKLRRGPAPAFFLLASFVITFAPLANLIQISSPADMGFTMAERFLYLPSAFFVIGAAWLLTLALRRPWLIGVATTCVVAAGGLAIVQRNADWRDDKTFFAKCLQQTPDAPLLHASRARACTRAGEHETAAHELETALMLVKYQTQAEAAALKNNLAAAYIEAGAHAKALPILEELVRGPKVSALYEYNLARCYLREGRNADARERFQKALQKRPHFVDALVGLAESYEAEERYPSAIEAYGLAQGLFPDSAGLHLARGVAFRKAGQADEAIREFAAALAIDSGLVAARGNMGSAHAARGDYAAARTNLEAAVAADPQLWDAQNALGMCYALQGDVRAARAKFAEILAADPNNTEALLNEGILFHQEKDYENARARFSQVLEIDSRHQRARSFLKQLDRKQP